MNRSDNNRIKFAPVPKLPKEYLEMAERTKKYMKQFVGSDLVIENPEQAIRSVLMVREVVERRRNK